MAAASNTADKPSDTSREWIKHARIISLGAGGHSIDEYKAYLGRLRPDAVHVIGTSHGGKVDFVSSVGPCADDDSLVRQRIDIAHDLGIKVIANHSGVGNSAAGDAHPDWRRVTADGSLATDNSAGWQMDLLSPYPEQWFLVQVEEMLRDYGADGLWVDGDCWYLRPSYSQAMVDRFKAETGFDAPRMSDDTWPAHLAPTSAGPTDPDKTGFSADAEQLELQRLWLAFNRKIFREFQQKTGQLCHRYGAVYASNGTHSLDSGPDPVPEWMDYLSHDIPEFSDSGCTMSSLKARFNDTQGIPHDVMTWDHNSHNPWGGFKTYPKAAKQYFCETASAIANGAIWNQWTSRPYHAQGLEIADFIRARRDILSDTESAAQIAVLHSTSTFYVHSLGLFKTTVGNKPVWGAAHALQTAGHHFDIVSEINLPRRLGQYRLIILANQTHLTAETVDLLTRFVRDGGRLIVAGSSGLGDGNTQALAEILGIEPQTSLDNDEALAIETLPQWIDEVPRPSGAGICTLSMPGPWIHVQPTRAKVICNCLVAPDGEQLKPIGSTGWCWESAAVRPDPDRPFLTLNTFGRGRAFYIAGELFGHYEKHHYFGLRSLILDIVRRALPKPLVRARAKRPVEISLRRRSDRLICHLVNINVEGTNVCLETQYQRLPPTGPVRVELRLDRPIASVQHMPTGEQIPFRATRTGPSCFRAKNVDVMESFVISF